MNKVLNNISKRSGEKPKEKKKRLGKNNISQQPLQKTFCANDLDFPIPCRFTEYYNNEEPFVITFLTAPECKRAKCCMSCNTAFPKNSPPAPESEIVFIHRERYERPIKDSNGNFVRMTITKQLGKITLFL